MTDHLEQAACASLDLAAEFGAQQWERDEWHDLATRTAAHLGYMAGLLRGGAVQQESTRTGIPMGALPWDIRQAVSAVLHVGLATRIGAIERQVVIQTTVNNPLPERGSDSIARVNRRQHALGLFG